jgi:hypothetical protein
MLPLLPAWVVVSSVYVQYHRYIFRRSVLLCAARIFRLEHFDVETAVEARVEVL